MPETSHGGRRPGAGRPRIAERQLSARISDETAKVIEDFSEGHGMTTGLRNMADFSSCALSCVLSDGIVTARFRPIDEVDTDDADSCFAALVERLQQEATAHNLYGSSRNALTVKARLPLQDNTSLWILVPVRRTAPPSKREYAADKAKILDALSAYGIDCTWIDQ